MIIYSLGTLANHDCPDGWVHLVSSCYYFSTNETTWSMAKSYCRSVGGNLAVPMNRYENDNISKVAVRKKLRRPWIGFEKDKSGNLKTVFGSEPAYVNWCSRQPNNYGGPQNCVNFYWVSRTCWNDWYCHYNHSFICEYRNCKLKLYLLIILY